jgi:protein O-mannosyl-transferase
LDLLTAKIWRSAFVAAVFAIHPLRAESVPWIAERKDVLSGLFFALTLLAWSNHACRKSLARYLIALLAAALGTLSKPMLVTIPFVLLLIDYWPLNRFQKLRQLIWPIDLAVLYPHPEKFFPFPIIAGCIAL